MSGLVRGGVSDCARAAVAPSEQTSEQTAHHAARAAIGMGVAAEFVMVLPGIVLASVWTGFKANSGRRGCP
ncbi:MAG: hypothetical protein BroJett024_23190 [Alphaproteobacteria bacterium]|nr:MAG: hypothetical protein BroJett024_23190 [Alphaproteobacteria bacterium]